MSYVWYSPSTYWVPNFHPYPYLDQSSAPPWLLGSKHPDGSTKREILEIWWFLLCFMDVEHDDDDECRMGIWSETYTETMWNPRRPMIAAQNTHFRGSILPTFSSPHFQRPRVPPHAHHFEPSATGCRHLGTARLRAFTAICGWKFWTVRYGKPPFSSIFKEEHHRTKWDMLFIAMLNYQRESWWTSQDWNRLH